MSFLKSKYTYFINKTYSNKKSFIGGIPNKITEGK
jgi:hypothetical protein